MNIAVLPFNAAQGSRPGLARQATAFAGEIAKQFAEAEIHGVNYMARYDEGGLPRFAMVNPSEELNDPEMLDQFYAQTEADQIVDGLLREADGGGTFSVRVFNRGSHEPQIQRDFTYKPGGLLSALRDMIVLLGQEVGDGKADLGTDEELFGTSDEGAFINFLMGYDAMQYADRAQGMVASEFSPQPALDAFLAAIEADKDWDAPYLALIQFCRLCAQYRLGESAEGVEAAIKKMNELRPDDPRGLVALGDHYGHRGDLLKAADAFEKALKLNPEQPEILSRLAMTQLHQGMPVNAERNLRKAVELEGEDKPSLLLLENVLAQTGRAHEIPVLWKEVLDKEPQNALAHGKYAAGLLQAGKKDEAIRAFDLALESLEDNLLIKRFYAPVLAQLEDFDRAMDFYEDCIDHQPTDIPLLLEYAQTLQAAKREFEVPDVLRNVLSASPDTNTRAQVQAWLIEVEQPKRIEAVKSATEKAEAGDFEGALAELKPLRQWLADYWRMWALLANAHNQLGEFLPAEEAARNLLELFPAFEPGYGELRQALAGQGKVEEAYNLMAVAIGNMPNSLPVALNYAMAAKEVGNADEARNLARQIREAVGNQPELEKVLAQIEA